MDRLAEELGDLPLALEQAVAYLEETDSAIGDYLDLLTTRADELFQLGRPATTEQTITTIWSVSIQRLHSHMPGAEDLLCLCAFLAADDIPRALLAEHPEVLPERLAAAVWATAALRLLLAAFPDRLGDADAWPEYARLLPHALAVVDHAEAGGIDLQDTTWLVREAGIYLLRRAEYQQARRLFERALEIDEAHLGADHPMTAQSLNNLAVVLRDQGDLEGARRLQERALAIREARLGADHPTTARSRRNLAAVVDRLETRL